MTEFVCDKCGVKKDVCVRFDVSIDIWKDKKCERYEHLELCDECVKQIMRGL